MNRTKKQIEESEIDDEDLVDFDDVEIEDEEDLDELEEDSVSDNVDTSPVDGMSKTNAMSVVMKQMSDMTGDRFVEFFNNVQAQVGHYADNIAPQSAGNNAASVAMKGAIKEDLKNIFGDDKNLSEDFRNKVETLFEAAVSARVAAEKAAIEEEYEAKLQEEVEEIYEGLVEKLDGYLSHIAEEWKEENEVAIENSIRTDLAESFITSLGQLYQEHNFIVPEEQVEVVEMMAERIDELEEQFNQTLIKNAELSEAVDTLVKETLIKESTEGLSPIEAERFKTLVEDFEFTDVDSFNEKLETIKEHHFSKSNSSKKTKLITEEIDYTEEEFEQEKKPASGPMKRYVEATRALKTEI